MRVFCLLLMAGLLCCPLAVRSAEPVALKTDQIEEAARHTVYLTLMPTKQGTGFLICVDPPLVVTAAHDVANYRGPREVWMHQNETGYKSQVKAVHLHPEYNADQSLVFSADVALLELELYKHYLGTPLRLKLPEASQDLRAREIVTIGFPYFVAETREQKRKPKALLREGTVADVVDFDFTNTRLPVAERPMLRLALETHHGDSGNPVIDRSGEVVGVVNGHRKLTYRDKETRTVLKEERIPVAIHVREVWKLLELKYPEVAKQLKQQLP